MRPLDISSVPVIVSDIDNTVIFPRNFVAFDDPCEVLNFCQEKTLAKILLCRGPLTSGEMYLTGIVDSGGPEKRRLRENGDDKSTGCLKSVCSGPQAQRERIGRSIRVT